jgi:hypothetical protein
MIPPSGKPLRAAPAATCWRAGVGVRIHIANNFFIRLEWAKSFGNEPQGGNGPSTFYMMMQAEA